MTASSLISAQIDMGQPLYDGAQRLQHQFGPPQQVLHADTPHALLEVLAQVQALASQGHWCVGGLSYEAASALHADYVTQAPQGPLAWFAVYPAPLAKLLPVAGHDMSTLPTVQWRDAMTSDTFAQSMAQIHAGIAAGDYYQINYTQQLHGCAVEGVVQPQVLFAQLQGAQPGGYALYVDMGSTQVASVSPELFFDWHQPAHGAGHILTRPMKGTAVRGATPQADAAQAQHLQTSAKERAENVMIVDLLRNDLGKLAVTGSVHVPHLFAVQALPTVWQMTSDVRAQLPCGTTLRQLMEALFPCGSVTGAPKRAAMQAIAQLETQARGWYCGALGVVRPDGAGGVRATFNVPIRSVVLQGGVTPSLQCGVGSGITADATAAGEWQEWHAKRAFVERISMPFEIVETLALDGGVFRHAPLHWQRMQAAAAHFAYPWDAAALQLTLQHVQDTHPSGLWRVRVALNAQGLYASQVVACPASPAAVYMQLAAQPMPEAHSEFVRFKTSKRAHYERFTPPAHVFDTLLWNENGEITEGSRTNVAAFMDGQWVTPPLHCGLLNGVGRQVALAQGRVVERVITMADVPRVQQWALMNSLRGWLPAQLLAT